MNSQPHHTYPQAAQKVEAPEPIAEKQTCGFVFSVLVIIISGARIFAGISGCISQDFEIRFIFEILAGISGFSFQSLALSKPEYLKGKPSLLKLSPIFAYALFGALSAIFSKADMIQVLEGAKPPSKEIIITSAIMIFVIICVVGYFMYGMDDDSGSFCLCFKPWIHKRPAILPTYGHYPPQGYPPQGYPPQGYPPQGYPPQGYPPQGYPQQAAYPPKGSAPQGHPQ
jgi:hypothetical protein